LRATAVLPFGFCYGFAPTSSRVAASRSLRRTMFASSPSMTRRTPVTGWASMTTYRTCLARATFAIVRPALRVAATWPSAVPPRASRSVGGAPRPSRGGARPVPVRGLSPAPGGGGRRAGVGRADRGAVNLENRQHGDRLARGELAGPADGGAAERRARGGEQHRRWR